MMRKDGGTTLALFALIACFLFIQAGFAAGAVTSHGKAIKPGPPQGAVVPAFDLPVPDHERDRQYLGLTRQGMFDIGQIKAQVLLIEVFSFYCPLCQMSAAHVNELYRAIEESPGLRDKIKLIGIGVTNTAYEVNAYRKRYEVPFPVFPDKEIVITELLGVRGTPTFIGIRLDSGGAHRQVLFQEGDFGDTKQFLDEIVRASGLN